MIVNRDHTVRGPYTAFAEVAGAYERGRPGYPDEAVQWLVGLDPRDVVDLGAGTGKLTRALVGLGHRVTAVEPLDEMRAELEAALPDVHAVAGRAEAMPLPDSSADVGDVGAGVPLVRPRRCSARDRPRPPPEGPHRARLELPRRSRPVDGAPERDHRQRVDRGVRRRTRSSTRAGCSVRSRRRSSRSSRRSIATGCSTSFSRAATSRSFRRRIGSRFSTAVGRLYDETAAPDGVRLAYVTECFRAERR